MPFTSIADNATEVSGLTTSGASARVQSGEADLPKVPLTGGKRKRSRKSQSKRRKSKASRRKHRRTAKK
jgi:hypothetical protein